MFQLERMDFREVKKNEYFIIKDWIYKKTTDRQAIGINSQKEETFPLIAKVTAIKDHV